MSQDQLKEQFLQYAENNLNNETILKAIQELLNSISNELYENGYIYESNKLTTCELIIKEISFLFGLFSNSRIVFLFVTPTRRTIILWSASCSIMSESAMMFIGGQSISM